MDIAISVEYAIKNLFTFHENPYNPSSIDRWAMPAQGVSVPYGPIMIFGYLPSLYGSFWFKICSLVYLAGILILSVRFAAQHSSTRLEKIAAGLFVTTFILMPRAIWNDIGAGVNDHFPVFLLLASLTLFQKKNEGLAGFLAGLSLAAKFSPAAFFILLFIRRTISVRFFAGVLLGALTMLPFFLWDQPRFLNDVFTFHFTKLGTKSGIRELLPRELHPIIWGFRIVCVLAFVVRNFWKDIEVKSLMREFTLLVILMNALYLEMHSNHIVWMLPTAAVLLTWYRFGALTNAKRILGGDQTVTQAESRG